jgi:hypothetical protein
MPKMLADKIRPRQRHASSIFAAQEIQVTGLIQIHFHAINNGHQVCTLKLVSRHVWQQGSGDRMCRRIRQHCLNFFTPPRQFAAGNHIVSTFIDDIIHFAAKSIERSDRAAPFCWQEQEAVVKTGAAFCSFFVGNIRLVTCWNIKKLLTLG